MSQPASPAAARVPLELWSIICSDILNYDLSEDDWDAGYTPLHALRALSATCRFLRDAVRAPLWRSVEVYTINELGRLRRVLKTSPDLGPRIKEFKFLWEFTSIMSEFDDYPEKDGTLLDMAFRDRWKLWSDHLKATRSVVESTKDSECNDRGIFYHDGQGFFQPGRPVEKAGHEGEEWYDFTLPTWASGPDGRGEDALIKKPGPLISFLVEVVEKFTSLHTMSWMCPVMPMPMGVLVALEKLDTLKKLHVSIASLRNNVDALPYWNLVRNLESLSITPACYGSSYRDDVSSEMSEAALASYKLPTRLPTGLHSEACEARARINSSVVTRTVIAAARTGKLRELRVQHVHAPFAVRALLPSWVNVQVSWSSDWHGWHGTAQSLRPMLAHASLWLGTSATSGPRQKRTLTGQEVQSLRSFLSKKGMAFCPDRSRSYSHLKNPIDPYLPWLEDAKLAQEVAEAWNEVCESVDADQIRCICDKCKALLSRKGGEKRRE